MATGTITVCGETVIDLVAQPDGDYRALPGGSPANVAVALARLGDPTKLLARLGADVFGRQMRAHLLSNGVDPALLVDAEEPSTLAVVTFDALRRATYDFWVRGTADWQWSDADLAEQPGSDCLAFHTGSLASWTPPGDRALRALFERVRRTDTCTLSYDPNVRPNLMADPATAQATVERMVALAHLVKASEDDLDWLYPQTEPAAVAQRWAQCGPGLVVVTLGPEGALAARPGSREIVRCPAPPVELVDTVGAGDTFMAGLLHGLATCGALGAKPLQRLADLSDESLTEVLGLAGRAAALTCTREGCDPPTATELDAFR